MHAVQILAALSLGGSELVAVELTEALRAQGHTVTVIAKNGPLQQRVLACGAKHLDWPVGQKRLRTLRLVKPLRQWYRKQQPDIIHVHSRFPAWINWLALRKLEQPPALVSSMHGHYSANPYSAVMAKADRVIAVSEHIRRYTLEHYPDTPAQRLVTVHGGVDSQQFPYQHQPDSAWIQQLFAEFPALQNRRLLLLPGRVTHWKGHLDFLQLLAQLRDQIEDIHAVIVGPFRSTSSYYAKLLTEIERLALQSMITFTGARNDMLEWYASAAIVYNLSDNPPEAFGRTVLEALSIGTPVLAWNQGGPAEQLAVLYPAGKVELHNLQQLLDRSLDVLRNPPQIEASEAFSLQQSMQKTLQVYQQAIAERNPNAA